MFLDPNKMGNELPFAVFPGIFASIDTYSKKVTAAHFRSHGQLPYWFNNLGELGKPVRVPSWSRFQMLHDETNILVTGVPDEILKHPKHGTWIGDYKTARFTEKQEGLSQMYRIQLNVYALIANKIGLGPVHALALLYYEPVTDLAVCNADTLIEDDSFLMRFSPKIQSIKLEPTLIPPLLNKVREIYDCDTCPTGETGCQDCERLNRLMQVMQRCSYFPG